MSVRKTALCLLLVPALAACAANGSTYPSLALGERVSGTFQPVQAEPFTPPAPPAGLSGRIAQALNDAESARQAFASEAGQARSRISAARRAAPESDAWARAQIALGSLESARSRTMIALADLDRLLVDAQSEGRDETEIAAALDEVAALVDSQNQVIGELLSQLQ